MQSDSDDESSTQLRRELTMHIDQSLNLYSRRPIVKHLNADSSWLISLPYPETISAPNGRCRYNIVIDAWLKGPQIDGFRWFSLQTHAIQPSVQSLDELNDLLRIAEEQALIKANSSTNTSTPTYIDAILCSHEFTDHCHEATLRDAVTSIPVFAPKRAATLIRSWKHFDRVFELPRYESGVDWRSPAPLREALPDWIGIRSIRTSSDTPIYFHSGLAITFCADPNKPAETIIYTPHGITADTLSSFRASEPHISILALIHGLHDVSLVGAQLNMGMENAIEARRILDAKYWFPTHDEVKVAHGLVGLLLKRVAHTIPLAPGSHPITNTDGQADRGVPEKTFHNIENGEVFILT